MEEQREEERSSILDTMTGKLQGMNFFLAGVLTNENER
jgi:hypothetical protein